MVTRCSVCGRFHFLYAGAPGSPYCSVACRENRRRKHVATESTSAAAALAHLKAHCKFAHGSEDVWLDDSCGSCRFLQKVYAEALAEAV